MKDHAHELAELDDAIARLQTLARGMYFAHLHTLTELGRLRRRRDQVERRQQRQKGKGRPDGLSDSSPP